MTAAWTKPVSVKNVDKEPLALGGRREPGGCRDPCVGWAAGTQRPPRFLAHPAIPRLLRSEVETTVRQSQIGNRSGS